jgi:hypothetical protein
MGARNSSTGTERTIPASSKKAVVPTLVKNAKILANLAMKDRPKTGRFRYDFMALHKKMGGRSRPF